MWRYQSLHGCFIVEIYLIKKQRSDRMKQSIGALLVF